ncbi:MAG: crossover junction endodeoxyribonuclease RuvC [bacterium]|nr:crossover junction endodeoxyribonuclease RuvC [bacterium]
MRREGNQATRQQANEAAGNPQSAIRTPQSPGLCLFLDPGSQVVGWALFDGPDRLVDAGRLVPTDDKAPYHERVAELVTDVVALVGDYGPELVVIEIPNARGAAGRAGRSAGHGLTVYGFAAGAIWQAVRPCFGSPTAVEVVDADFWTKGWNKEQRRQIVAAQYPQFRKQILAEVGFDMGDSIAMGQWRYWGGLGLERQEVRSEK